MPSKFLDTVGAAVDERGEVGADGAVGAAGEVPDPVWSWPGIGLAGYPCDGDCAADESESGAAVSWCCSVLTWAPPEAVAALAVGTGSIGAATSIANPRSSGRLADLVITPPSTRDRYTAVACRMKAPWYRCPSRHRYASEVKGEEPGQCLERGRGLLEQHRIGPGQ